MGIAGSDDTPPAGADTTVVEPDETDARASAAPAAQSADATADPPTRGDAAGAAAGSDVPAAEAEAANAAPSTEIAARAATPPANDDTLGENTDAPGAPVTAIAPASPPKPLPPLETLLTPDGFDSAALTRLVRESALGVRQKTALAGAIEQAADPEAQARLLEQLRVALGL